jgi:hypothetical protein
VAAYLVPYVKEVGDLKEKNMLWLKLAGDGRKSVVVGVVYCPDTSKSKEVKKKYFERLGVLIGK